MLNNPIQPSRSGGASSPVDSNNPFSGVLPRRLTVSSTGSSSTNKPIKIKPNSEIRIYGRYLYSLYVSNGCQGWSSEYGHEAEEGEEAWIAVGVDDTGRFKYLGVGGLGKVYLFMDGGKVYLFGGVWKTLDILSKEAYLLPLDGHALPILCRRLTVEGPGALPSRATG
jgi:hypothetical protein